MDAFPASGVTLRDHERMLLLHAFEATGGNQCEAARILRIGRDAFRYKLKRHNLPAPGVGRVAAPAG